MTPEFVVVFVKISSTPFRILDVEMRPPKFRRVWAAVHTTQISRSRNHVFTQCPFVSISSFVYFRIRAYYFSVSHAPSRVDVYLAFGKLHVEKSASHEVRFAWRKTGASVIEHFGVC